MLLALSSCALAVLVAVPAHAETWTRAAVAEEVEIIVRVLTVEELVRKMDATRELRNLRKEHHNGYAVLGTKAGAWRCYVYVTANATDATLEHERRHCHGWVHP